MSAAIFPITSKSAVDEAWEAYIALWEAEQANPGLAADRAHVERRVAAHVRFCELYAADCRRDNVIRLNGGRK